MNSKIIAGIIILVLIVVTVYVFTITPITPTDFTEDTAEVSSVLGEEYSALIQEELDKMSIEQTDFNNQIEEQIAIDVSQFYYD